MFSQRRKKYKNMVWASVLTAVAILALVALLGYLGSFKNKTYEEAPANEVVTTSQDNKQYKEDDDVVEAENGEDVVAARDIKKQTYYLLKYDNDVVRVYFSDQQGKLTELEETGIVFETLSTEDQQQFLEGIQVENRDALNRLLMDYES